MLTINNYISKVKPFNLTGKKMNYDNITIENFKDYENDFFKVIDQMENLFIEHHYQNSKRTDKLELVDSEGNNFFKKFTDSMNIGFSKLFKFSHNNNIHFIYCSSIVYENTFNNRFKIYQNEFIDVNQIEFIESEYEDIINSYLIEKQRVKWGLKELELLKNAETKKLKFLENILLENNCTVKTDFNAHQIRGKRDLIVEITDHRKQTTVTTKQKTNKSLLFNGKELNLSERFKIANEVLGIDTKIRTLNIQDLEKYQLLAYILGCDKDNARNLMNGSYKAKDRDLSTYFNDLGLNK